MSDNIFPIRYSQLNANALKDELAKRYDLNNLESCRFFDFGMNDIYVVKAGKETFYLRVSLAKMHRQCDYEEVHIHKGIDVSFFLRPLKHDIPDLSAIQAFRFSSKTGRSLFRCPLCLPQHSLNEPVTVAGSAKILFYRSRTSRLYRR